MTNPNSTEGAEPHPCRFFNGRCIDCGRAYGAPRFGTEGAPGETGDTSGVTPCDGGQQNG